jgi:ATP-dependent protease ClpP protease subunit
MPGARERRTNRSISLERQFLTYCKESTEPDEYALHLGTLAFGLNNDGQYQEALGIADRCLQIRATDLPCLTEKANALNYLGRLSEAKTIIQRSLSLGAITELDVGYKRHLQDLLAQVNNDLNSRSPAVARPQNSAADPPPPHQGSAKVTGSISCSGTAVGLSMDIDGEIDSATVESVRKLFGQYHEREAKVKAGSIKCDAAFDAAAYGVHYGINSPGGSVPSAMAIGRMFRKENAGLGVNGICISACVLILAGAVDRNFQEGSKVGIHRPYLATTPQQTPTPDQVKKSYGAMLQDIRSYLREMNVSEQLASDMLGIPPERVHILTPSELWVYGLAGVDPAEQQRLAIEEEAREVQEANQLGLDRREYIRRKAIGEDLCAKRATGDYAEFWNCKQRVLKSGQGTSAQTPPTSVAPSP